MSTPTPPLVGVALTQAEQEDLEEGTRCSAGLMCVGLMLGNYPAHVSWWLDYDPETTRDVPRWGYGWKFAGDPLDGVYCEDCCVTIEEQDKAFRENRA